MKPAWLTDIPMAHRGLHDEAAGIVENSHDAFAAAIDAGFGMECDIQISSDGEAMVFHDSKLDRMTEDKGRLRERTAKEIGGLTLKGSGANHIQTLGELLDQIGGRTPLLVEIKKTEVEPGRLEDRTLEMLKAYSGPVAIMSFNPKTVGWFANHAPDVVRGQLSTAFREKGPKARPALQRFAARHLLINAVSRPHFIGYDINHLPTPSTSLLRALGMPILTWTVRTQHQREIAERCADNIIFEGFNPGSPSKGADKVGPGTVEPGTVEAGETGA